MTAFPSRPARNGAPPRIAWLFDIDGTLLLTGGASREAFSAAVAEVMGVEDDLRDIGFAGRTEPLIFADILKKLGRDAEDVDEPRFWSAVFERMRALLRPDRGWLLPGVPAILDAIDAEPRWVNGLLTGNMTGMAEIKLEHFGIAQRFAFGAFGQEAKDRNSLACLAVERAATYGVPPERCIVVGDTEHDIACARAAGARAVAVATGGQRLAELQAFSPDRAFENLADHAELLEWARELSELP
jgi:phosphoglycolate phosphatase-like HAD superfamily hydrolase